MIGFQFTKYTSSKKESADFEQLLDIFLQLIMVTGGEINEALHWLTNLDAQYQLTSKAYSIGNFVEDLKDKGYIAEENQSSSFIISAKGEQKIRKNALEEIFGKLKKNRKDGYHATSYINSTGNEINSERRSYLFGDSVEQIAMTESIRNAQITHGISSFKISEDDLEVLEKEHTTQVSTVLMIDISHSMVLYGEDRITPAKKVAMALTELITKKYKKDTLDIIVFGNDAWKIHIKDLPYLKAGPYHTNTVAGLQLSMNLLQKRKNTNKQIFMITDGKPTCLKEGLGYYKNSFGLDLKIINKTLDLATRCKRLHIPITTFMIASDPYLQEFVRRFTIQNNGNAYYSNLQGLGRLIFEDYKRRKLRKIL